MTLELSNLGITTSIIPGTGYPNYAFALRTMCVELGMTVILPYPLAIGTPELYHVSIIRS
jgi:hypothetical protein